MAKIRMAFKAIKAEDATDEILQVALEAAKGEAQDFGWKVNKKYVCVLPNYFDEGDHAVLIGCDLVNPLKYAKEYVDGNYGEPDEFAEMAQEGELVDDLEVWVEMFNELTGGNLNVDPESVKDVKSFAQFIATLVKKAGDKGRPTLVIPVHQEGDELYANNEGLEYDTAFANWAKCKCPDGFIKNYDNCVKFDPLSPNNV